MTDQQRSVACVCGGKQVEVAGEVFTRSFRMWQGGTEVEREFVAVKCLSSTCGVTFEVQL
jgi:hypothetical protein